MYTCTINRTAYGLKSQSVGTCQHNIFTHVYNKLTSISLKSPIRCEGRSIRHVRQAWACTVVWGNAPSENLSKMLWGCFWTHALLGDKYPESFHSVSMWILTLMHTKIGGCWNNKLPKITLKKLEILKSHGWLVFYNECYIPDFCDMCFSLKIATYSQSCEYESCLLFKMHENRPHPALWWWKQWSVLN